MTSAAQIRTFQQPIQQYTGILRLGSVANGSFGGPVHNHNCHTPELLHFDLSSPRVAAVHLKRLVRKTQGPPRRAKLRTYNERERQLEGGDATDEHRRNNAPPELPSPASPSPQFILKRFWEESAQMLQHAACLTRTAVVRAHACEMTAVPGG